MKDVLPYTKWFEKNSDAFIKWLEINILTTASLVQLAAIAAIMVLAYIFSRKSAQWLESKTKNRSPRSVMKINVGYTESFFLVYAVSFLWLAVMATQAAEYPNGVLSLIANLGIVWALIRFTSATIESEFWARLVAINLWVIAALNIVGWLDPTITTLEATSFKLGSFELSLLIIIKGIFAFALLLWVVSFVVKLFDSSFKKARGLTPSQRVLFSKLSAIFLYTIGALIGLNIVGLDLTALAAFSGALGLGIGFGLQKVFGNLISGIILLVDKSVKPGDVIAIGDTYGWVNKLGGRCVSVLTRDGKEHLIPNENLITNEVENWSYSDQKIRLHIPIGVSYASDVHKVKKVLLEALEGNERILELPKPVCLIHEFADSSINYELRCWIEDPEQGIANVRSEIYFRIWDLFKENGIEIPFPQRDVHLKFEAAEELANRIKTKKTEKRK